MFCDVRWFIYALVSNGALSAEDAMAIYNSIEGEVSLELYAQAVLEQLAGGCDEQDASALLEQIQEVVNYAAAQGATGENPPMEFPEPDAPDAPVAPAAPAAPVRAAAPRQGFPPPRRSGAVPPPRRGSSAVPKKSSSAPAAAAVDEDEEPVRKKGGKREGLVMDSVRVFSEVEIDYSVINGYEDLPSLSDTAYLDDSELEYRMIYLLSCLRHLGCSDLHISAGSPPFVRRQLQIERIDSYVLTAEDAEKLNMCLLSPERAEFFRKEQDTSFSLEVGSNRFRVCMMFQKDGISGSYRLVPDHICQLEELGFMERDANTIRKLLDFNNGLILVTGPIGAGKTTTLAAMVDVVNERRSDHVITVEEPIEILQMSKNCAITLREIGKHTISYHSALKAALREDPDIIVVGEMHDLETIENAITAAETGHLVIGTLHTGDAANTLNRLLDVFPPSQQAQIRAMTAGSLRGIICQKQIPNGMGGIELVYEIMINSQAVANLISEGKTFQLKATMAIGSRLGMFTMDQLIMDKFNAGLITYETALSHMGDSETIAQMERQHAIEEAQKLNPAKK
ncbi:MAG: PilT/PilU family type 4a pilus ATPase [Lentisphaeria bacterium]|nr:PilT/PilU family type 4a pilus ATPase [Lentisphaeria bacterium]